jgi:hypothetical protein
MMDNILAFHSGMKHIDLIPIQDWPLGRKIALPNQLLFMICKSMFIQLAHLIALCGSERR